MILKGSFIVKEVGDALEHFYLVYNLVQGVEICYVDTFIGANNSQDHCYGMMSGQGGYEVKLGVFPQGHYSSRRTSRRVG